MKANLNLLIGAGLLLLPALPLQASVDSMLTLVLKCYTQDKISTAGTTDTGRVAVARIDSKQLLILLEKQLNVNFPRGAQLKVTVDGKVYVTDSKAVVLNDVSTYLQATLDRDNRLFHGTLHGDTGQENSQSYFPLTLTFNLLTLQGTITGIAIEKFTASAPNSYGIQHISGQSASTVNGMGSFNGRVAYFDGSLRLTGKSESVQGL